MQQDYSVGLTDSIQKTFTSLGGQVLDPVSYSSGDADFRAILTQVRAQKPDAIFATGYYPEAAIIVRQARELGMTMPILGGDGWVGDALKNGREALKNTFISNHYSGENPDPLVQNFRKAYRAKFNREPDSIAALGYDAAKVLADSIARAASTDGPKVRDAIAAANVAGVTGQLKMDASRNVVKPAVIEELQFVNGDVQVCLQDHHQPELVDTLLQQFINGLSLGAIYALIALGYTMVYGVLRLINFAHGDVYMLGAFAGYYLANAHEHGREPVHPRRDRRDDGGDGHMCGDWHRHRAFCLQAGASPFAPDVVNHRDWRLPAARVRRAGGIWGHAALLSADDPVRRPTRSEAFRRPTRA